MESGRFIHIINGNQQTAAKELTAPEHDGLTVTELADLGWYQLIEVELPAFNSSSERLIEYNYAVNVVDRTATPLYRVEPKYDLSHTQFKDSCPACVDDLINADLMNRESPVLQALAKGKLTFVGTI